MDYPTLFGVDYVCTHLDHLSMSIVINADRQTQKAKQHFKKSQSLYSPSQSVLKQGFLITLNLVQKEKAFIPCICKQL